MFIEPMYACPLPNLEKNPRAKPFVLGGGKVIAEEKYDGIRLVTEINDKTDRLFVNKGVACWTRYGNDHTRKVSDQILEELAKFPNCIIDGEIMVPSKRSYGTMTLDNKEDLVYYLFDILQIDDEDITAAGYTSRREALKRIYKWNTPHVQLAPSILVETWDEVYAIRDEVWNRDGEGLILKRVDTPYTTGKRPKNTWIKIKKLQSQVFTVTGFLPSRGKINDRGPYGMTCLIDADGITTQVKTKDDAQCRLFEERGKQIPHPDIGRLLWCEYQERTPDNEYRHIRWDHWDGE